MALADGGVVLEAALGERDALILQVRDLRHAAAAEVAVLDGIVGELGLGRVDDDLAVLGLAVGDGDGHGLDAALVAAPAGTRIVLGKHLVLFVVVFFCFFFFFVLAIRRWATGPQWKRMILSSASP